MGEQVLEALVCILRGSEPRKLAHCPNLASVPVWMDSARIRILSWKSDVPHVIVSFDILWRIEHIHRLARQRRVFHAGRLRRFRTRLPTRHCLLVLGTV